MTTISVPPTHAKGSYPLCQLNRNPELVSAAPLGFRSLVPPRTNGLQHGCSICPKSIYGGILHLEGVRSSCPRVTLAVVTDKSFAWNGQILVCHASQGQCSAGRLYSVNGGLSKHGGQTGKLQIGLGHGLSFSRLCSVTSHTHSTRCGRVVFHAWASKFHICHDRMVRVLIHDPFPLSAASLCEHIKGFTAHALVLSSVLV